MYKTLINDKGEKFIPLEYLTANRDTRLQVMAGLADSDCYLSSGGYEIVSKWVGLANDIAFLARSLGLMVTMATKDVRLDGWDAPRTYQRLRINGHLDQIPCRVPRRKAAPRRQIKDALRTGFSVDPIGHGEYAGFMLDGDGRFLLGDFTVTHNTFVTKAILNLLDQAKLTTTLASPTGRASKRMSEASGKPAATIHRTLGIRMDDSGKIVGFGYDRTNTLPSRAVTIDESSMIPVDLGNSLVQAIKPGSRVVLIGDVDQLPSVGPGAVLRDVITSGVIPTTRLTRIFRQAEGSAIIEAAHAINTGKVPRGTSLDQATRQTEFITVNEPDPELAAETIVELVTRTIPKRWGFVPGREIQVLTPMNRGKTGTIALNEALQARVNPRGPSITRSGTTYRVGDPVLHTKNDAQRDVFNGDRGFVTAIDTEDGVLIANYDGREVRYEGVQFQQLMLSYASSVHRSQGSTIPCVVMALLQEHRMMLSRPILYTGVTRAAKLCVLVSDPRAVAQAVRATNREDRRTRLADLLRGGDV